MLETYKQYVTGMGGRDEVLAWVSTVLKNKLNKTPLDQSEVEHILDYLMSDASPQRLLKMSYEEAKSNTEKWVKILRKRGADIVETEEDLEPIHEFSDGAKIVRLKSKKALEREGHLMRHCVGSYSPDTDAYEIYSYRDASNMPHATFEYRPGGGFQQLKGKGNGPIHPRYIEAILVFLKSKDVPIRSHEMKSLGYLKVPKALAANAQEWVKQTGEKLVFLFGDTYIYSSPEA